MQERSEFLLRELSSRDMSTDPTKREAIHVSCLKGIQGYFETHTSYMAFRKLTMRIVLKDCANLLTINISFHLSL